MYTLYSAFQLQMQEIDRSKNSQTFFIIKTNFTSLDQKIGCPTYDANAALGLICL